MDLKDAEARVLELCGEFKQGITQKIIQNDLSHLKLPQIVGLLNKLLAGNKIDLLAKSDGDLIYKLKDPGTGHAKLKGADPEEQVVFKIIEESGCRGIWAKDIRQKSNLHQNTVVKVVKKLEGKKMIKSFTSVAQPKKMRYMLYNLDPDSSLTGGAWYSDKNFDTEFVELLTQRCNGYMEHRLAQAKLVTGGPMAVQIASYVSAKEVLQYITNLKIFKVSLRWEEIENILDALVYDGKAQRSVNGEEAKIYRSVVHFLEIPALMTIPCGMCPNFELDYQSVARHSASRHITR